MIAEDTERIKKLNHVDIINYKEEKIAVIDEINVITNKATLLQESVRNGKRCLFKFLKFKFNVFYLKALDLV